MSGVRVLVMVVIVGAVLAAGYGVYHALSAMSEGGKQQTAAHAETSLESSEITACKKRLQLLYQAWKRYRTDHKGAEPPSFVALLPKYIAKPELLYCPTADRVRQTGGRVAAGNIHFQGKDYPETYGFLWLSPNNARLVKMEGDNAPLITCAVHQETIYRAAYKKSPSIGAFDAEQRAGLVPDVRNAAVLLVRRNGKIDVQAANEQ
jgi:hypothetical protein